MGTPRRLGPLFRLIACGAGVWAAVGGPLARAGLPEGPSGAVLGPWGVGHLTLVDLPDLALELDGTTGGLRLRDRRSDRVFVDGEWPEDAVTAVDPSGATRWVRADAEGRVTHITWATGRRCTVDRDDEGRVTGVSGPGTVRARVSYDGGVLVEDTLGSAWSITSEEGRVWSVRDAAGRQVRVSTDPDSGAITSWEDPRGLSSLVRTRDDITEVVGPGGGVWRVGSQPGGGFVEQPNGLRWSWVRDADGRVARIIDPSGVHADWRYDRAGRVVSAELAGRRTVLERDADGRPVALASPSGATVRLRWEGGHVGQITDASGAAVVFERDGVGHVEAVLTRAGGRWELGRDLDGRVSRITDPAGRKVELDHDGAGRVVRLDVGDASTRVERDAAGRVVGVVDASGLRTGLVRDPTGLPEQVRRPGRTLTIERDAAGEVVGVREGRMDVTVRRDASGRAVAAGPIAWARDLMGLVDRLVAPGIELWFAHDTAGRLSSVRSGDLQLVVARNPQGDPMQWSGSGAAVRVERDAAGRVVAEQVGGRILRATRGIRGSIDRVDSDRGTWRWSRGPDASVLRVDGPDGTGVGTDRDEAGRVTLARLPGGGLLRRAFEEGSVYEQLTDGGGDVVVRTRWTPDARGNLARAESEGGPVRVWKMGPDGALVALEEEGNPEASWAFGEAVDRGPGGWVRAKDVLGRTTELMVTDTWPVWGAVGGAWAYTRGPGGALTSVSGADGAYVLTHDRLGRLTDVHNGETRWVVVWDAIGRPFRILRPTGVHDVVWSPGQIQGTPLATGPGGAVAWMDTTSGTLAWSLAGGGGDTVSAGAVELPGESGPRVEDALGLIPVQRGLHTGVSDSGVLDPIGSRGGILLFAGGPELFTGGALDPAGPERTDGTLEWPWASAGGPVPVRRSVWEAADWDPIRPWGEPLQVARDLGLVDIPEGTGAEVGPVAWPWLPESFDRSAPLIGPARGTISLEGELEPLVWRVLQHLTEGEGPLPGDVVMGPGIRPEELGDLPPGVTIPGLRPVGVARADFSAGELSKKVVASWGGLL